MAYKENFLNVNKWRGSYILPTSLVAKLWPLKQKNYDFSLNHHQ